MNKLFRMSALDVGTTLARRDEPTPLNLYEQAASLASIGAF